MQVEVDQGASDKDVNDSERVGNDTASGVSKVQGGRYDLDLLENEIVGVARRRRKHDDDGYKPVFE